MLSVASCSLFLQRLVFSNSSLLIWFCCHHRWTLLYFRYFQHASGEIFVISRALAQFISINRWAHGIYHLQRSNFKGFWFDLAWCLATEPFSVHMPMMMSVLDRGLLDLMWNMFMKGNYAAHRGRQVFLAFLRFFFILLLIITSTVTLQKCICWFCVWYCTSRNIS